MPFKQVIKLFTLNVDIFYIIRKEIGVHNKVNMQEINNENHVKFVHS